MGGGGAGPPWTCVCMHSTLEHIYKLFVNNALHKCCINKYIVVLVLTIIAFIAALSFGKHIIITYQILIFRYTSHVHACSLIS